MSEAYVLTDDGKRIYGTKAEIAARDVILARIARWHRDVETQRQAFQQEADALREAVIARAAAEAKAEESDE